MQFLRLNETCRMICYSILSNNVNLVEIGFEWGFVRSNANISYKIHLFFGEKKFDGTRHLCKKNEPTLDRFGGGGCTVRSPGS